VIVSGLTEANIDSQIPPGKGDDPSRRQLVLNVPIIHPMKKYLALFVAVFVCLTARGLAQVIFDPSVGNSFTNLAGFTGTWTGPGFPSVPTGDRMSQANIQTTFANINPNPLSSSFFISGISLRGQGITDSLTYSNLSVNQNGNFATAYVNLNNTRSTVDLTNARVSFTIPGGVLNRGSYFGITVQYRSATLSQVVTSTDVTLLGGGRIWTGFGVAFDEEGEPIGPDANWGVAGNWAGNDVPVGGSTVDFLFGGTNNTTSTNNLDGLQMRGIEFLNGAGALTMGGNSIDFNGGKIENNSANTQTINFDFTLNGIQSVNPNTGDITLGGGGTISNNGFNMEVNGTNDLFLGKTIQGSGGLTLNTDSRVTVSANQTFTGPIIINSGAILLLTGSNQINDNADISLSGGTIRRGDGVSEVFGDLNLTDPSFLDFGTGSTTGTLAFGTYTPTLKLDVLNFSLGNALKFGNDVSAFLPTGGALSNAYFSFNNGFTYNSSTFTITAIPEPSTYVAAAGLLAMFLWSARRRLFKTAGAQVVASGTSAA